MTAREALFVDGSKVIDMATNPVSAFEMQVLSSPLTLA